MKMTFDIYADVYDSKFEKRTKHFGTFIGISFGQCCDKLAQENSDFNRKYDSNRLTYDGYELYGTMK